LARDPICGSRARVSINPPVSRCLIAVALIEHVHVDVLVHVHLLVAV
jgi:hypothetical protein